MSARPVSRRSWAFFAVSVVVLLSGIGLCVAGVGALGGLLIAIGIVAALLWGVSVQEYIDT